MKACNFVTSFSFIAFTGLMSYAYMQNLHTGGVPLIIEHSGLTANEMDLMYFMGFFLLANVVMRIMVNRYALRIYRKDEEYTAVFEGQIPLTRYKVSFKKGEVSAASRTGILPWKDSRYKINDRKVLLLDEHFRTPHELNTMMGHDKFKLD